MSLGSTGPGIVPSSAQPTPLERPEAASLDPAQISFAGVLAQLFQSAPPTSAQPDFGGMATSAPPTEKTTPRDAESTDETPRTEPREGPQQTPPEDVDRNVSPEDSAAAEQPLPPARPEPQERTEAVVERPELVTAPVVVEAAPAPQVEAPPVEALTTPTTPVQAPVEAPTGPILARADLPLAQSQTSDEPSSLMPAIPQDPPDVPTRASEGSTERPAPPAPAPAPTDAPLPPILRSAEVAIEALGAAPAQAAVDTAPAPVADPAAQADPIAPRIDIVTASSQVTAAGVAPTGQGAEAGLDTRTGQPGTSSAPPAVGAAAQGTPAADMGQAAAPRRVDPGPVIDRVVRGMRLSMKSGQSRMRFLLTPPSLGSVTVDLEVKHGVLSAHIAADSAEARDLLSRNISALTDSLRDQGIRVGDVTVSARQDGERGNGSYGQPGGGLPAQVGEVAPEDPRAYADERRRLLSRDQIVDLMA